ncbi:ribosomal protein S19-domain-containing protein [Aspergillus californicus]
MELWTWLQQCDMTIGDDGLMELFEERNSTHKHHRHTHTQRTRPRTYPLTATRSTEIKKRRQFRKFTYRGIDLDQLLDLSSEQLRDVVHARARRRFNRGLKRKPMGLIKKLRKAKQEAKPNEKPDLVKTHLRDMIVVPEMIGSVVGIYSGKEFNQIEVKPEMVGHYLGEFSIS